MASKLGKMLAIGAVIGASVAAFVAYKKKCDAFEKELEEDFEDEDVEEEDRSYTSISISDDSSDDISDKDTEKIESASADVPSEPAKEDAE